jgi:hypothetical protein
VLGLKTNLSKSKIVPIGNLGDVADLATILGCGVASLPMKYLGLPWVLTIRLPPFGVALLRKWSIGWWMEEALFIKGR